MCAVATRQWTLGFKFPNNQTKLMDKCGKRSLKESLWAAWLHCIKSQMTLCSTTVFTEPFGPNVTTELTFMCKIDQVPLWTLNQEIPTFTICKLSATLNQHAAQNGRMWCVTLKITIFDIIIRYQHLLFIAIQPLVGHTPIEIDIRHQLLSVIFFFYFQRKPIHKPKEHYKWICPKDGFCPFRKLEVQSWLSKL